MHGQKRDEYKARLKDSATAKKLALKAQQWNALSQTLLKRQHKTQEAPKNVQADAHQILETLHLTEKLLAVNPDPVYLWNFRREILLNPCLPTTDGSFLEQEQLLTQTALQRNPKAYGAWFHRKWSIRHHLQKSTDNDPDSKSVLQAELGLCGELLMLDERNFHCWNYRRFIVGIMLEKLMTDGQSAMVMDGEWKLEGLLEDKCDVIGAQLTTKSVADADAALANRAVALEVYQLLKLEWDFTTEKIEQNFSNGSAFHYRSKLLPLLLQLDTGSGDDVRTEYFQGELELIRNAVFTEPDDQTSWWYLRFIISWANPRNKDDCKTEDMELFEATLYEEWSSIQELVEGEGGKCKWGLLGLHMIAAEMCKLGEKGGQYEGENWEKLSKSYLVQLRDLDPDRRSRYDTMLE
jgi:geranylgeranyl transferase type-2 subunit alpha